MEAWQVMNHTLTALLDSQKPAQPKRDPDLTWTEYDDLGDAGWVLHLGYSVEWDDGNAEVWIHRAELNTGQRVLELSRNEIDVNKWEAVIKNDVEGAADVAAQERGYDRDDRGDWLYEQRKDREASK